ncbi:HECT-domain-containing protein [Daldinia loculata]|uniref:HECT-domain-containing protein n=1 Tax=Daldinia loculata TaxID=103429 RepID=UPI0020C4803B|nr:HECT-domain-containing protein [Daldinia loculata]KAI1649576.1 HECT-domain-containing protein [Daldinia loculata]
MSRSNRPFGHYDFPPRDPSANEQFRRPRGNSRRPEFEPLRNIQVQVDSSSDDDDDDIPVTKPNRPAQHSRSMSHPFPSLFSSKKRKNARPEDESGSGDFTADIGPKPIAQQNMAPRMIPRGPVDFATGNCMTCASLVRWPKELHIFRCTICLTINDLKPYDSAAGHTGTQLGVSGASPPNETEFDPSRRPSQCPNSISLDRTKHIIKQCLRSSLEVCISAQSRPERTGIWPGRFLPRPPNEHSAKIQPPSKQGSSPTSSASPPSHVYNAVFDDFADLNLEPNPLNRNVSMARSYSTSYPDVRSSTFPVTDPVGECPDATVSDLEPKIIFKKLEEYLVSCFSSYLCINNSFATRHMSASSKLPPEAVKQQAPESKKEPVRDDTPISELDPKLLLLGDVAENGTWWTGGREEVLPSKTPSRRKDDVPSIVSSRSPRIDWGAASEWYHVVVNAAQLWPEVYAEVLLLDPSRVLSDAKLLQFESLAISAQEHIQQVLLKCTETLLKRPCRLMKEPRDIRFLLLMLANPLLISGFKSYSGQYQHLSKGKRVAAGQSVVESQTKTSGRHSGIIKRILGLLANSSEPCHHHLVTWFSRLPEHLLLQTKDLINGFIAYRLNRQSQKTVEPRIDVTGGLIPQMSNSRSSNTAASLHAALESSKSKKQKLPIEPQRAAYTDDWQIKAAARVMALVYSGNTLTYVRRTDKSGGRSHGHLIPKSDFYNSLVDGLDFKADFELWESRRGRFTFCQYPFFLSIWAKIQILEFDAKRQMAGKAREAFFDSILTHRNYEQYLNLNIRRECLVEDSLKQVSEVVGSGSEEIKKGLRIEFRGEEGIDGGGLRKEWFLLLVREVFNPDHGLFVYDEDSNFCYFNPNTFETSDQYFLVGVVLGLAIYNSTILDVALPPFAFRKLLASAPPPTLGAPAHSRPTMNYTLDDLAEFRPVLAKGLRQLLGYEGDVQSTFCLDFVIEVEKYGTRVRVPLCPGGESKMVTNANRREYVDLYVRYLLDTSVSRQFEPFKRGFFTVCAGNALTLFKPEEIELLIRGSDESLDITALQGAAAYTNWPIHMPPDQQPTIQWFWDTFERASITDQRRLLSFITGSDRIPAMGAASLVIKINCLGIDEGRFPSARTCFNILGLYRYASRQRLEEFLWRAVNESEGFGLK